MRYVAIILTLVFTLPSFGQNTKKEKKESLFKSDRRRAFSQVKELHEDGAIVLRLILHKKNAQLYREAGNVKLADRLEKDLIEKNKLLALTLLDESFTFCPIYIVEAENYGKVINGQTEGIFLNKDLKTDSSIVLKEKNIYFMDVGSVYEVVRKGDSFLKSEVTSTPVIQNALVIKDKNLTQLMKPFPFNAPLDGIFLDIANFVVYNKGKTASEIQFTDMESYNTYMRRKYRLSKKEIFTAQKIFNLNLRLFGFYTNAKVAEVNQVSRSLEQSADN